MSNHLKIKGGLRRNVEVEIYVDEQERRYLERTYRRKVLKAKVSDGKNTAEETLKLAAIKGYCAIKFHNDSNKLFGKRGDIYIVIDKKDWNTLKELEKKIEEENKKAEEEAIRSIPLKFVVKTENLTLLDMFYEAKVFVANRTLLKDEEERYKKLLEAIKKYRKEKYHLDGYIDAREFEEGQEFTLEQLEEMFKNELEKYENFLKKIEEKKRKEREEYEKRKKWALEEAKRTGKEVIIRKLYGYDGDTAYPGQELGWVNVYEVATPDGEIKEKHVPSY